MASLLCSGHDEEVVRALRRAQHRLQQHFVLSPPDTGLGALKDTVDHARWMVRIESSDAIEPCVPNNLWTSADSAVYQHTGRVIEGSTGKPLRIACVVSKAAPPYTAESSNCHEHQTTHLSIAYSSLARHITAAACC